MKPLLKWVGGKTQLLKSLLPLMPHTIKDYHEIFIGGGSVLLSLLSAGRITGTAYASDANQALIGFYNNVKLRPDALYKIITPFIKVYKQIQENNGSKNPKTLNEAKTSKESYYYWIRKQYNLLSDKESLEASVLFLFLNKTCFRGMFRESSNGFNVPYGNYKKASIINEKHLKEVSRLLQKVVFTHCFFEVSLQRVQEGDFVYLDPPYAPEKEESFVGYTKNGFSTDQHKKLFALVKNLKSSFIMSNSNVNIVHSYFSKEMYSVKKITARRAINSKKPGSTTKEVIISPLKSSFFCPLAQ